MTTDKSTQPLPLSIYTKPIKQGIVNVCSKIIGQALRPLSSLCQQQTSRAATRIIRDPSHCLLPAFVWLPSGQRLCCPWCRTQRQKATFVPEAVRILNCDCSRGCLNTARSLKWMLHLLHCVLLVSVSQLSCLIYYLIFKGPLASSS